MKTRTIHPKIKVLDRAKGIVEYVASDETLDSYREIIRVAGWKFDERFTSNPIFLNSHRYGGIEDQLGKVLDWRLDGGQLIEVVQWAIDVEQNALAQLGFQMTDKGYLKAVSVGFMPVRNIYRNDDDFTKVADEMKITGEVRDKLRCIFYEQQQWELSACVIGANPSALAKAIQTKSVDSALVDAVGLGGDEGAEVLGLCAEAWDANSDPAIRKLTAYMLRQHAREHQTFSAGRADRGTVPPQPGRGASGGVSDQTPRERKRWLEQVARGIGLQN